MARIQLYDSFSGKWELKNYWDDGCTIECRYFATKKAAKEYAESEGYVNYKIVPNVIVKGLRKY